MSIALVKFRLSPSEWLPADQFMLQEASKPFGSRLDIPKVASHVREHCLGSAHKIPTYNAVKRRYETHFLGGLATAGPASSMVELADTMMESAAKNPPSRTPSQLAKEIKKLYFKKSKSELHTIQAIEMRYRNVIQEEKWVTADEYMQSAARTSRNKNETALFRIGLVVNYIKEAFFSGDASTSRDDVEHRYCERWLKIANSAAEIEKYDNQLVQEACYGILSNHESNDTSRAIEPDTSVGMESEFPAWQTGWSPHPSMQQQHTALGDASQGSQSMLYSPSPASTPVVPDTGRIQRTLKRPRPKSELFTVQDGNTSFPFPEPPPSPVQSPKKRRDSGVCSVTSINNSSSLLSRMSRLSVDIALCQLDHRLTSPESPCIFCRFPERDPRPRVYLAPEYHPPQPRRAEDVDADEMDNGNMMTNANATRM